MPNYRNNPQPYNNYRQVRTMPCMTSHGTCEHMSLAMAYVPWQTWRDICDAEKALHMGTIFQELNLPFLGKGGVKR